MSKRSSAKLSSTTDWFARVVAGFGFLLSLSSAYFAYHWHQQALEERILVRLDAIRRPNSRGTLVAEVVNLGLRPIYIEKVVLVTAGKPNSFFVYSNLIGAIAPVKSLEPGQADDFSMFWNFSQSPVVFDKESGFYRLENSEAEDEDASVCIQTTRAVFRRSANITSLTSIEAEPPLRVGEKGAPSAPTGLSVTIGRTERSPMTAQCP